MQKENLEIERKYIIEMPSALDMSRMQDYTSSEITQIYLESSPHVTHRVRKREYSDKTEYTETKKIRVDRMSAIEEESKISEKEFSTLSENIRKGSRPLAKCRHTFLYSGQIFEIDVYPEWKKSAIMETELSSREEQVIFPSFIRVIKEVTGERAYSNSAMSTAFPEEIL